MVVYSTQSSRRPSRLRLFVYLLLVLAVAYGIYRAVTPEKPKAMTPPPPAVTVQEIEIRDIPLVFEYPARLAGSREVEIRARVGGILLKRAYTEGQFVKRGDLLFQIDPAPYEAAMAQTKATFMQAEADYKRAITLKKQKALSPREFDQANAAYGAAKAQYDTAAINLAFTTVRAPISGYTSQESFSEGTLVVADQTLLTRVTQLDPMYVEFAYPDSEAMMQRQAVASGAIALPKDKMLRVAIEFRDGTVYPQEGQIRFTDSIISPETGTVQARATVDNRHQSILPGQFVRVKVKGMTQVQSIGVPERAVMQGPMGTFVYTVDAEGKAAITKVKLGLLNNGLQIVTEGLAHGDLVITDGMIKVKPGQPVCIDTAEQPCQPKKPETATAESKPGAAAPTPTAPPAKE